jgi:H+-transporting ATPase
MASISNIHQSSGQATDSHRGLTADQAHRRLLEYGPNAIAEEKPHLIRMLLGKFWSSVPWMLEATIALELVLGKFLEAAIIAALLLFNALVSLLQEGRARGALALLRRRLAVKARALRDGIWRLVPAEELVPGDFVHLRMGDIVPADIQITEGNIQIDQSALTGESMPLEAGQGAPAYAGAIVRRGEASGEVCATGQHTYFGKTAELVRSAETASHLENIIFAIVKYLVAVDAVFVAAVIVYAVIVGMPFADTLPFALILLVASVPVALPATFTLATALGALELAHRGVLVTRLSAVEEAAAMEVLCSDKTGTITQNRLTVEALHPYPPFSQLEVLRFAAFASDEATQDPIDLAILARAKDEGLLSAVPHRLKVVPFDPATKLSEAVVDQDGQALCVLKGAPQAVINRLGGNLPGVNNVEQLAAQGYRVLAVAAGPQRALRIAGLLALQDAPRSDSKSVIDGLRKLGVRVLMITGDGLATARAIAAQVGISGPACTAEELQKPVGHILDYDVFAGVFPEDKFRLIGALQQTGCVAGMTGDGVNDAPALKQAEVGIAVADATDVAKASASLVLTKPGLECILAAVETSRRIYQRMLTYTLNKIIKTVEIGLFLSLGVILTRSFIITPLLIVLLLFTNDFVTMSIATDRVSFSHRPDRWQIRTLMAIGFALGSLILILFFGLFFYGREVLGLRLPQLQTLVFVTLVFTGQGTIYVIRERRHFWSSTPSSWMLLSSLADVIIVTLLASRGILMAPLPLMIIVLILVTCLGYLAALDFFKVSILRKFRYAGESL